MSSSPPPPGKGPEDPDEGAQPVDETLPPPPRRGDLEHQSSVVLKPFPAESLVVILALFVEPADWASTLTFSPAIRFFPSSPTWGSPFRCKKFIQREVARKRPAWPRRPLTVRLLSSWPSAPPAWPRRTFLGGPEGPGAVHRPAPRELGLRHDRLRPQRPAEIQEGQPSDHGPHGPLVRAGDRPRLSRVAYHGVPSGPWSWPSSSSAC